MIFKEVQRFTQWWLWILLTGIGMIPVFGIYKQFILGEQFGDKPLPDFWLIIMSIFIFGLIAMIGSIRLKTEIDQYNIKIHFFPFVKKHVSWKEVKNAEVLNYGFVGGWGIRLWTAYGTVYNTKGNKGLAIELLNGKKFLIGTQKEAELRKVVDKINSRNKLS